MSRGMLRGDVESWQPCIKTYLVCYSKLRILWMYKQEKKNYSMCLFSEPTVDTLVKDINYSPGILLSVPVHIS